jgi:Protein-glutamine gamma-glutamyltransferase
MPPELSPRTAPDSRGGILIFAQEGRADALAPLSAHARQCDEWLRGLSLSADVQCCPAHHLGRPAWRWTLTPTAARRWTPHADTLGLSRRLGAAGLPAQLAREIAVAMLAGPVAFEFPSFEELAAHVVLREHLVVAAKKTALDFHTTEAERPAGWWTWAEGRGFTVLPGQPLTQALVLATQPDVSGQLYSFSCYRATEYVILLGLAQALAQFNPPLLAALQAQWEARAIMSGQFHEVFLREYGSMDDPLPPRYYVPGDRLWFRNPDEPSSDVTGFEGSWVFYLGEGLFTNFWRRGQTFTMQDKCLEIYHWRYGLTRDSAGELAMDESVVADRVAQTRANPVEMARIEALMMRLRDPKGVYAQGGCIDTSREYPRWICPGTADLVLPGH